MTNTKNNLLFISGFPSGGTDLTKTILNAHPDIKIAGEVPFLVSLTKAGFDQNYRFNCQEDVEIFKKFISEIDVYNNIRNLNHDFSSEFKTRGSFDIEYGLFNILSDKDAIIHGIKTPQYTEHLDTLYHIFPNARFLIVVRDVRDVCLSWKNKWGKDQILCSEKWASRMKKAKKFSKNTSDNRIYFFRFEDLLKNPKHTLENICNFLNINFSERLLEHEKHTKEITDGKINYGKKIICKNKAKWQTNMPKDIACRIEEIAWDTMELFEYQCELATKSRTIRWYEKLIGRFRDMYAIIFVVNRQLSPNKKSRHRLTSILIAIKKQF